MNARHLWMVLAVLALMSAVGCDGGDSASNDSGPDADTDSDSDTDTGSDVNGDNHWIVISGGTYQMGTEDLGGQEMPVHEVVVPGFEIQQTEVTVAQYAACVDDSACAEPDTSDSCSPESYGNWGVLGREDHPVTCVDWYQALAFCVWIGGRLPSEAEWEYAARSGGQDIKYPWGDDGPTCEYAVMNQGGLGCGTGHTMAVCSKTAGNTDQGLCDMVGNVYEHVQDWWNFNYAGAPADGSAWESGDETRRVGRGGGWLISDPVNLHAANRFSDVVTDRRVGVGFRCARSSL